MAEPARLELRHGGLELDLCPEIGGCIAAFRFRNHDLLRPAGHLTTAVDVQRASTFPLVPFSNRVGYATFTFERETVHLAPNFPPEPHAIHGVGWELPWRVAHAGESSAELVLRHAIPDTPFDFEAVQHVVLASDRLELRLALTNRGERRMPAGIGYHPFFVRTDGATLQTQLRHVWLPDEEKLPRERIELPETWDFSRPRPVSTLEMDHCFDGWDGEATICWPETARRVIIEADPVFRHAVIFIPPGADFFCFEPVTNANDAFNLAARGVEDVGMVVLAPGETLEGTVNLSVD